MNKWTTPAEVTILGTTYKTKEFVNRNGIKNTIPVRLPKKMVSEFAYNREILKPKIELLKSRVHGSKENFRAFPVFLANDEGLHELYDAHHLFRVESSEDDEFITCYVNWWVNPNDDKAKLALVRKMNADQTNWKMWDFLKSNSDVEGGHYTYLKDKVVLSIKFLSPNVICSAYLGETRFGDDHAIKAGGLVLTPQQISFGDWFISNLYKLRNSAFAEGLNSYTMRYFASLLHETSKTFNDGVNDCNFREFGLAVFNNIRLLAKDDRLKKMNQEACKEEYNDLKNSFLSVTLKAA